MAAWANLIMTRILRAAALSLMLLPLAGVVQERALAQEPVRKVARPNPENGAMLAKRWCASCHIVAKDQTKAIDGVPPFATLAARGDLSGEQLAFVLLNPHPAMPAMTLTRNEARDLSAYIAAQK
jgi:mono/diheme cytochrome c family protein